MFHRLIAWIFYFILLLGLVVLESCATAPERPDAEAAIAQATGVSDAVVFLTEGGPLDSSDLTPSSLALTEAVRQGLRTDPGLQAALSRVWMALADLEQAKVLPNPVLNILFRFPNDGGSTQIEASLTQEIVSLLQRPWRSSAAEKKLRSVSSEALSVALDLVAEIQESYISVQALEELMPVLDERRRILSQLLNVAKARLEAGEGTRADVATLDAQRVELELEIAERQLERREERLRLTRLVGQPSGVAEWKLDPWHSLSQPLPSERTWIETALSNRPEIQGRLWELAALGDTLELAKLSPFEGASVGAELQREDSTALGPSLSIPIPLFDTGEARRKKIEAERSEVRHKLTEARRKAVEEVRRALESFSASQANVERVRTELIPLQERRRSLAESAYRAGQTDTTAVFLAEQDLRAARAKQIELEKKTAVSLLRLERAVGGRAASEHVLASGNAEALEKPK